MDFMITQFSPEEPTPIYTVARNNRLLSDQSETLGVNTYEVLPPENDNGNIEYKAKLINPSVSRLQHLVTQMKWRLREGQGEAIYEIGVEDGGKLTGLTNMEMEASMTTLRKMASAINANLAILSERIVTGKDAEVERRVAEVLVRKVPDNQQFIDIRLAILGSADAGKSTLCGVLTQGVYDNGQGKARLNLFRYLHEFRTGKTSSICLDLIGFSSSGELINYKQNTMEEIVNLSTKIITLIDLAGDSKYLKTTIYGVSSLFPHYCALIVNARVGPTLITREHLGLAMALNIPIFIIVTKIDNASTIQVEKVLKMVENLIARMGMNRVAKRVKSKEDAVTFGAQVTSNEVVPIFAVSNVTGENFDLFKCFLNVLPPATSGISKLKQKQLSQNRPLFSVEEIFRVGNIFCGILSQGILYEGDSIQIGPDSLGRFHMGKIDSIRRNKQPVFMINPGEAASVAVSFTDSDNGISLRRGIVIMSAKDIGISCKRFVARFYLLYHPATEICIGFQGTVYLGTLCRTATIVDFDPPSIQPCVWVNVVFEFYRNPEFVLVGTPLIFRMGQTKGMGEVISVSDELPAELHSDNE